LWEDAEPIAAVVAEAAPEDAVDEIDEFTARPKRLRRQMLIATSGPAGPPPAGPSA